MAKALESKNRANSTAAFVCAEEGRYVEAPTRYHRLLIAVDAAHLLQPTGAKDLNLALSSEFVLTHVPEMFYQQISPLGLERYSVIARLCEWKSDRFAGHMTLDLHTFFDQVSSDE